jgi:hypothetical protein
MRLHDSYDLAPNAAAKLERLRRLAVDYQTICQQAPHIWDGETVEDARLAKSGCNGEVSSRKGHKKIPPCPIRNLCLETAIATQSHYGVWGGLSALERKTLRKKS